LSAQQRAGTTRTGVMERTQIMKAILTLALVASFCGLALAADEALMDPSALNEQAPDQYNVTFKTSKGEFVIAVNRAWAPLGADRFYNMVTHGFYDQARFFRVVPNFVVQWGMPADPEVGAVWRDAPIKDEEVKESNLQRYITFAKGGPDSRTTQVFINLRDNARLDGMGFPPFGKVIEGWEIVEKLYSGYGEGGPRGRGPSQELIGKQGNVYLEADFPKLDYIESTTVSAGEPAKKASE
jgi:peptidyl-prolyl cis-trans isomerase A (cyclophilin A)